MMTHELDREIAEQLGYHAECVDINFLTDRETWCLVTPDGEQLYAPPPSSGTEKDVWEYLAPKFSTDIGEAMALIPEWIPGWLFMLRQMEEGWVASITVMAQEQEATAFEKLADTPAEAICMVWLEWQRSKYK